MRKNATLKDKDSIKLLKFMLERQLKASIVTQDMLEDPKTFIEDTPGENSAVDISTLMAALGYDRQINESEYDLEYQRLEFDLKRLIDSGDLVLARDDCKEVYIVQNQAAATIERYELDEQRHKKAMLAQWIIASCTLIIAISTTIALFQ